MKESTALGGERVFADGGTAEVKASGPPPGADGSTGLGDAADPPVGPGGAPAASSAASAYLAWNDALAARFFSPEAAGERVYLFVTEEVVAEVGQPLSGGLPEFISAIREGPPGLPPGIGHCQRAVRVFQGWRLRRHRYPPYIAYLALFVLAGGHKGDYDPRSYYPRLWDLLEEDEEGTPPSFHRMLELWDDLERWSIQDRQEELGIFEARIVGQKTHIGFPLAQTLLTEDERHSLPRIFAEARLDPGTTPSDHELLRAMRVCGGGSLTPRTMRALTGSSSELVSALLDVAADEFINWTGEVPADGARAGEIQRIAGSLRLCVLADPVSGRAHVTVRCHTGKELPGQGLRLAGAGAGLMLRCSPFLPRWSNQLQVDPEGAAYGPQARMWRDGLTLTDESATWSFQLRPARIRAFIDGRREQLPGFVEVAELPRRTPFYLALHSDDLARLQGWLDQDATGWKPLQVSSGLPPGWKLIHVPEAVSDAGPKGLDERLRFADRRTMRLTGGIRAARANTFFSFAPPRVVLEGGQPGDGVFCNDREIKEAPGSVCVYELPGGLPLDQALLIEVRHGEETVRRRSLFLVTGFGWALDRALATFNRYGRPAGTEPGAAGASLPESPDEAEAPIDLLRTPGLRLSAPHTYFVGRLRGQLAIVPPDPLPEWRPVWAIPFARNGDAIYCGASVPDDTPISTHVADAERVDEWREILWWRRKRIREPRERHLKSLWRLYQEAARRG